MTEVLKKVNSLRIKFEELTNVSTKVIVKSALVGALGGVILSALFIASLELGWWI